jgi:hypothetical protein
MKLLPCTNEHGLSVSHPLLVPVVGGWHHDGGEFRVGEGKSVKLLPRTKAPVCSSVSSSHVLWSLEHSIHVHNLDSEVGTGAPATPEGESVKLSTPGVSASSGASGSPPGEVSGAGSAFSALTRSLSDSSTRREM